MRTRRLFLLARDFRNHLKREDMKIAMLVNNPCRHDTRVMREAEALVDAGHSVTIYAHGDDGPNSETRNGVEYRRMRFHQQQFDTAEVKDAGNLPTPDKSNPIRRLLGGIRSLTTAVITRTVFHVAHHAVKYPSSLTDRKLDAVHAHDLDTLLAGYLIARKHGAKLIYDAHELETGRNGKFSRWERWWQAQIERYLIRKADRVVTVCDSIAECLQSLYGIDIPTVVLNTPQSTQQHPSDRHIREAIGLGDRMPLAIYIGSVTINRGLENTVYALAHAKDMHLAMIGPRSPETEKVLIEIARDLDLIDRLHLVDPVPPDEVISFVRSADVSLVLIQNVCKSYELCLPNKLFESLFAGIPVAVAKLVELETIVNKTSAGLIVDETDPVAIANGAMEIIINREKYTLSAPMMAELQKDYGWETQRKKLVALYDGFERAVAGPAITVDS